MVKFLHSIGGMAPICWGHERRQEVLKRKKLRTLTKECRQAGATSPSLPDRHSVHRRIRHKGIRYGRLKRSCVYTPRGSGPSWGQVITDPKEETCLGASPPTNNTRVSLVLYTTLLCETFPPGRQAAQIVQTLTSSIDSEYCVHLFADHSVKGRCHKEVILRNRTNNISIGWTEAQSSEK